MTDTASVSDEDRDLMRRALRGLLAERWPAERAVGDATDAARLRAAWRALADQGVAAFGAPGADGGLREALVALQELGRAACPVPLADAVLVNLALGDAPAAGTIAAMRAGDAFVCLSFGAHDADAAVGSVRVDAGRATGTLDFVEAAIAATHLAVVCGTPAVLALVDLRGDGVRLDAARALGHDGQYRVTLDGAPVALMPLARPVDALLAAARLLVAARAVGAADRAFELAVDYVKQRRQFGQVVGRFQALQHKLANQLIALLGTRLALDHAAEHFDRGVPEWRSFAAAAFAHANPALRQVSLETQHAFGAIGYAEAHEAPRHFRRVHLDVLRHGGARAARAELAREWLDHGPREFPETDLGEAGNAFRREVRAWLAEHWPEARRDAYAARDATHRDYDADFARELGATGWLGLTWPRRFGGLERSPYELLAFMEEMNRADAPRAGAPIQAQSWMIFGRPEQQARYLPEILRGEVIYGMWYSEPDSGSDLASLRTRAVRDGDHWVIDGQKIWTTTYWGDYMWLAARTDTAAKPSHAGISMFVVPTDTPGITRRPMRTMYDGEFCNTFFDGVRVPADALVGEENGGWAVLTGSLGTERAFVGSGIVMKVACQFEELCDWVRGATVDGRPLREDPLVRDTLAGFAAQIEVGRRLAFESVRILARGEEPTWEAAIAKVWGGELMERFNEAAMDLLGLRATLSAGSPDAPLRGRLEQKLRHSLMWVISLGTNEIQRSLIAQRALGLPR